MTFLNPAVLFGIFAISVPIILHFFNLRRIKKVEFSTLMFLKELQKTKIRRIKLRQILLLIIRCLIITFLVLAFADPVYKGIASDNSGLGRNVVIMIDNSFSMEAQDISGTYLSKAKQEAVDLIASKYSSGNNDIVYAMSSSSLYLNNPVWNSLSGNMVDSVKKIEPSYLPFKMSSLLSKAGKIVESEPGKSTELFIISDLAKNNFSEQPAFNKNITGNQNIKIYFVNTGNREVNNLSVQGIDLKTKLLIPGNDVSLTAIIKNHSQYNVFNKPVSLFIKENGDKEYSSIAQKVIDIGSGEEVKADFTFKSNKGGVLTGYIELARNEYKDDEIIKDNKFYFSLNYPSNINAGILASGESEKYISTSLRSFSYMNSANSGSKNDIIKFENASINSDLLKYDILFVTLDNLKDEAAQNKIKAYADSGRTIFFFPSSSINVALDVASANKLLKDKLGFCFINSLNENSEANKILKIQKIDRENEIFEGIFKNENDDSRADSPVISKYIDVVNSGSSKDLITLSNGKPLLLKSVSPGKNIFLYTLSADMNYSDLPLKSIFAPVIVRAAFNSVGIETPGKSYLPGSINAIPVKSFNTAYNVSSGSDSLSLSENNFVSRNKDSELLLLPVTNQTITPSNYFLYDKARNPLYAFSIDHDTLESDMKKVTDNELKDFMTQAGVENFKKVQNSSEAVSDINKSENGVSLWKYMILIAMVLIAGEILLSKSIEKT